MPVCLWAFTTAEAWAWSQTLNGLVERRFTSPWDDPNRHPSHADKRRAWRRELLRNEIQAALRSGANEAELQAIAEHLLDWAA